MSKYITYFDKHDDYTAPEENIYNVSYCNQEDELHWTKRYNIPWDVEVTDYLKAALKSLADNNIIASETALTSDEAKNIIYSNKGGVCLSNLNWQYDPTIFGVDTRDVTSEDTSYNNITNKFTELGYTLYSSSHDSTLSPACYVDDPTGKSTSIAYVAYFDYNTYIWHNMQVNSTGYKDTIYGDEYFIIIGGKGTTSLTDMYDQVKDLCDEI